MADTVASSARRETSRWQPERWQPGTGAARTHEGRPTTRRAAQSRRIDPPPHVATFGRHCFVERSTIPAADDVVDVRRRRAGNPRLCCCQQATAPAPRAVARDLGQSVIAAARRCAVAALSADRIDQSILCCTVSKLRRARAALLYSLHLVYRQYIRSDGAAQRRPSRQFRLQHQQLRSVYKIYIYYSHLESPGFNISTRIIVLQAARRARAQTVRGRVGASSRAAHVARGARVGIGDGGRRGRTKWPSSRPRAGAELSVIEAASLIP